MKITAALLKVCRKNARGNYAAGKAARYYAAIKINRGNYEGKVAQ